VLHAEFSFSELVLSEMCVLFNAIGVKGQMDI
jgi:hypothetical protein